MKGASAHAHARAHAHVHAHAHAHSHSPSQMRRAPPDAHTACSQVGALYGGLAKPWFPRMLEVSWHPYARSATSSLHQALWAATERLAPCPMVEGTPTTWQQLEDGVWGSTGVIALTKRFRCAADDDRSARSPAGWCLSCCMVQGHAAGWRLLPGRSGGCSPDQAGAAAAHVGAVRQGPQPQDCRGGSWCCTGSDIEDSARPPQLGLPPILISTPETQALRPLPPAPLWLHRRWASGRSRKVLLNVHVQGQHMCYCCTPSCTLTHGTQRCR